MGSVPPARTPPSESGRGKTALGVRTVPVDPVVQARYSLPEPIGALVVGLVEDLPASRAGLPTGSVIVAFDRQPVRSPMELTKLVSEGPTDRPVTLEYILPGGESRAADVSLVSVAGAGNGISAEIHELRRAIESFTKRLDELERRAIENR
jgi:membrane-associated protease RseP (regulator of RpoE activity)